MNDKEWLRFIGYVDVVTDGEWECWEWQGKKCHRGYGRYWYRGQWRQAHRYSVAHSLGVLFRTMGYDVDVTNIMVAQEQLKTSIESRNWGMRQ